MTTPLHAASGSTAEDLFIELFSDTFGAEKAGYLYSQYHFYDIYNNDRFADFMIENGAKRIAIEIDDEASHNPRLVSDNKFYDDLLKQNSMIHLGWDVYRWAVRQMQLQPDTIKDELRVFFRFFTAFPRGNRLPSMSAEQGDRSGQSGTERTPEGSAECVGRNAWATRNDRSDLSRYRHRQNGDGSNGRETYRETHIIYRAYQ